MSEVTVRGIGIFARLQIALAGVDQIPSPAKGTSATPESTPNGKEVVYRILFNEYWPRVRRHLASYLENPDEVDEVSAEVFVVAWRKLNPSKPMGLKWFLRTADNKLRDVARRDRSKRNVVDALTRRMQEDSELHPLEVIALRQALHDLNARERQVVVLTYWDGLTAAEVSDVLRCSQAAVWTTLTRARAKLRAQLETPGVGA
ncbi:MULTISPECIES: RNA polymerase sigma factor [unclassified Microbacterium]|uniref:RNA polymerase sigma factor n=1 Tax=unclassified Microbacterium TaxID=2609290 RepID=UPI001601E3E2|nr:MULTISPECIES: sigma-70 family RNA polymerase sigma factor [unclassified Microbacterium]MBT2484098.1 sigma-70 family RNA polymerase sigma factor [Microbacterium sp. ISL-108]